MPRPEEQIIRIKSDNRIISKGNEKIKRFVRTKKCCAFAHIRIGYKPIRDTNSFIHCWIGHRIMHGENFIAIFTSTLSVVIGFSTGTMRNFATLVYVFTMRVVIYDILSMAIIPTLSTSILFCNLCYILL